MYIGAESGKQVINADRGGVAIARPNIRSKIARMML
jgi:hypothetical protein